ncbi:transposase [Fibrobacteria bacterium R8-3-H12]
MEKTLTFADLDRQPNKKITRRTEFLCKMEQIVPWPRISGLIRPHYHSNRTGRPAIPLDVILRMYFLQIWFSLSDEGLEDSIYDIESFRTFMGVSSSCIPDATVLCNFRKLVNDNGLGEEIMDLVSELMHKNGLIMHGGTIVDATIHEAPKSTRNEKCERDSEMSSTKKHGNWHFGAKSHIGVDAGTGLVHSVEVTPANVHDSNVATQLIRPDDHLFVSDSGYIGLDKRPEVAEDPHLSSIEYRIVKRPSFWKKRELSKVADEFDRRDEHRAISIRQKVEYVFHVVKDIFKFRKLPYKGIAKNRTRLLFSYASANLYMLASAGRRFCPLLG